MNSIWNNLLVHENHELRIGDVTIILEDGVFTPNPNLTYSTSILLVHLPPMEDLRVADVGTGSGIIAIIAAIRGAKEVIATDISDLAVRNAIANTRLNHVDQKVSVIKTNLLDNITGQFDVICANLPISKELWETDTDELCKTFLTQAIGKLTENGKIYLPWGSFAEEKRSTVEKHIKELGCNFELQTVDALGYTWYLYTIRAQYASSR